MPEEMKESNEVIDRDFQESPINDISEDVSLLESEERIGEETDTLSEDSMKDEYEQKVNDLKTRLEHKETFIRKQQSAYDVLINQQKEDTTESKSLLKPSIDKYDNDEDYFDALVKWEVKNSSTDLISQAVKQELANEKNYQETVARVHDFEKKANVLRKDISDFDDIAKSREMKELYYNSPVLGSVIESLPKGPDIAYYLGKNMDVALELSQLPIPSMVVKLSELNANFVTEKQNNISRAPTPISPLSSSSGKVQKEEDDMGYKEWLSHRLKTKRID